MSANLLKSRCTILGITPLKNIPKCCYASKVRSEIIEELEVEDVPKYEVEAQFDDDSLNRIRDKSRLNPAHRNLLNDKKPYTESYDRFHDTVWYKKRVLGKYGIDAAGVTPAICWPTKEEIEDAREYERLAYVTNIKESMKEIAQRKIDEALEKRKREEEIDKVVANFDKWRAALEAKLAKKEAEVLAAKLKREKLLEEVREQVGYNVDPRDERFKTILEQKEKEDKKKKKEEKKKIRQEKLLAYIQRTNAETTENEDKEKSDDKTVLQKNEGKVDEKDNAKAEK